MSKIDDRRPGAPSNTELAERTARIEEQVEHVADTVDRIEERLDDDLAEQMDVVETNRKRTESMWTAYRIARWTLPTGATVAGALVALGVV